MVSVALCSLALNGCPQLLQDNFRVVDVTADAGGYDTKGDAGHYRGTAGTGGVGGTNSTGGNGLGGVTSTGGASSAGGLCNTGPFTTMVSITGLNVTGEQWGPALSSDDQTLYFSVWDGTTNKIYAATRPDRGTMFSSAAQVSVQGAPTDQATPYLSYSGLNLYFNITSQAATADKDIWVASRTDTTVASFANALALGGVNSTSNEGRAWLSRNELTIYFSSDRPLGVGDFDIWIATRAVTSAAFSAPTNLGAINSTSRDESPVLSNDGLTLYFATSRADGKGQQDIWTATRADTNSNFTSPAPLSALNSVRKETDIALSHDEGELFFASDSSGTPQIWRATRHCAQTSP